MTITRPNQSRLSSDVELPADREHYAHKLVPQHINRIRQTRCCRNHLVVGYRLLVQSYKQKLCLGR